MSIQIKINGKLNSKSYVGWTPQPCTIRETTNAAGPLTIALTNVATGAGGAVLFGTSAGQALTPSLDLTLQPNGTETSFIIAGSKASIEDQDVVIEIKDKQNGNVLLQKTVMVRVRKNANHLNPAERDRFLQAYVQFNLQQTSPNYEDLLQMHDAAADLEIHSDRSAPAPRFSFLPWHRAYLLELERLLQQIDESVALPYWKFDEPAKELFTADFIGEETSSDRVKFNRTNPLIAWSVRGSTGIIRKPYVNMRTEVGQIPGQAPIRDDGNTLAWGMLFAEFIRLEGNPHGLAHSVFKLPAPITDPTRAPQDPLFFLLHCNIDRLWALWQKTYSRYDINNVDTYPLLGTFNNSGPSKVGDYAGDTMWPWNGDRGPATSTRPTTAPGGTFPQIAMNASPSPMPFVWEMIDYQGQRQQRPIYADYDTISFLAQHTVAFIDLRNRKIRSIVELSRSESDRLTEKVKNAKTMTDINMILDEPGPIDPRDREANEALLNLATNHTENKNLRLKAFKKITDFLFEDAASIRRVLQVLADGSEPLEIRHTALYAILAIRFNSPAFKQLLPDVKQVLHQLMTDADPELKRTAIEVLASLKDEAVQQLLIRGLQDTAIAVVPDSKAIQLLALDLKSNYYPVIRNILAENKDPDVQREAVYALSHDPVAQQLISNLLADKNTHQDVRLAGLVSINSFHPQQAVQFLKSIIADQEESNEMKITSLNLLGQHTALPEIHADHAFGGVVEQLSTSTHPELSKMSNKMLMNLNDAKRNAK